MIIIIFMVCVLYVMRIIMASRQAVSILLELLPKICPNEKQEKYKYDSAATCVQ